MTEAGWSNAERYEAYVGRWSSAVAREFLPWLEVPPHSSWLDVGCGTGSLSSAILRMTEPARVFGVDPSPAFVEHARDAIQGAEFAVGEAEHTGALAEDFDAVVFGLVLNFVPDPGAALVEARRVLRGGGTIGAYVWDYAGEMWMMRHFWDVASDLFPSAATAQEGLRFEQWQPDPMEQLFHEAGLREVESRAIRVRTVFRDLDDYWLPFLGGQGPAPTWLATLEPAEVERLRGALAERLPIAEDGSIPLTARTWAVRGTG